MPAPRPPPPLPRAPSLARGPGRGGGLVAGAGLVRGVSGSGRVHTMRGVGGTPGTGPGRGKEAKKVGAPALPDPRPPPPSPPLASGSGRGLSAPLARLRGGSFPPHLRGGRPTPPRGESRGCGGRAGPGSHCVPHVPGPETRCRARPRPGPSRARVWVSGQAGGPGSRTRGRGPAGGLGRREREGLALRLCPPPLPPVKHGSPEHPVPPTPLRDRPGAALAPPQQEGCAGCPPPRIRHPLCQGQTRPGSPNT